MKFSQSTMTVVLLAVVAALSVQTFFMFNLIGQLDEAQIGLGASPSAVDFTTDGAAPDMVGGC